MKRLIPLILVLLLIGCLTLPASADAIVPPDTPIDRMGEIGGAPLIILVLVVLPLALIVGVVYLTSWLIRKIIKKLRNKR